MKNKFLYILISVLFLVTVYYLLTTTQFVRFWADDFCSSVMLRNNGYWQSQVMWWKSWTGRYSYIAFLDLVEIFGLIGAQLLPVILFALFVLSFYLLFGLQISLVLSVLFLLNSPSIIQSFYWMTGSLNYFAPFVFLNFYLSLLFRKRTKYINLIGFVLIFIAVGFSESFGVALLFFLIFLCFVLPNTLGKRLIAVGFIPTVLSLGLMYLSPGNAARSATVSHPDGLTDLISKTFIYSKWYLIHLLYIKEFILSVMAIVVGAFVVLDVRNKYFENPKKVILYSTVFIVVITFAVVGLTYQAMNWEPPMRVMTIVNYMIMYSVIIDSVALVQLYGKHIKSLVTKPIFIILIILLIFQVIKQWGGVNSELKIYANGWDAIETKLIDAPDGSVVSVPELKPVGKLDGFKENKGWVSSCIAGYYNLDSLEYK
jgi:hypothetical protein